MVLMGACSKNFVRVKEESANWILSVRSSRTVCFIRILAQILPGGSPEGVPRLSQGFEQEIPEGGAADLIPSISVFRGK